MGTQTADFQHSQREEIADTINSTIRFGGKDPLSVEWIFHQMIHPTEVIEPAHRMRRHPPELLLLDEPTNHLDFDSIEAIEDALQAYDGGLLIVSHDRRFLENIGITRWLAMDLPV